jgi:hypothetical protein
MSISRSGSVAPGSGRNSTAFMALKMVVTAPVPSEMTSTATRGEAHALHYLGVPGGVSTHIA